MLSAIWIYAASSPLFKIAPPEGIDILSARFIAGLLMHINVEKDVRNGLNMMKYAVNHH